MEPEFEPGSHYQGPLYRLPGHGRGGGRHSDADAGGGAAGSRRGHRTRPRQDSGGVEPPASGTRHGAGPVWAEAEAILRSGRLLLLDTLSQAWRRCLDGETHSLEQKADLQLAMAHAMSSAVQAVDLACGIAGTTAFRATSPLERCFRDVQTMRHHVFASEHVTGPSGQVYLGLNRTSP